MSSNQVNSYSETFPPSSTTTTKQQQHNKLPKLVAMVEDQSGHYPFLTGASPKPRNGGYLRAFKILNMTKNYDESQVHY